MNLWQAIVLGFIQGVTELLPISSSGHLVLLQNWMNIDPHPFYFDIFVHLISVIVIIYFFRNSLRKLTKSLSLNLILATIPLVVVGLIFRHQITAFFANSLIAGIGLLITASLNFYAAKKYNKQENKEPLTPKKSLLIGLTQAIALVPGISRSGSTLFGSSLTKLNKNEAFEFSFLMAIPAILAASCGELISLNDKSIKLITQIPATSYLAGGIVCFITSLFMLRLLKLTLEKSKYHYFGWYCLVLGFFTLTQSLL